MRHLRTYRLFSIPLFFQAILLYGFILFVSCGEDDTVFDDLIQEDVMNNEDGENSNDTANDDSTNDDNTNDGGTDEDMEEETDNGNQSNDCPSSIGFVFEESNGIVSIEFEDNNFPDGWVLRSEGSDFSGTGYMQWEGNPSMGNPGNGMVTFPVRITNPGTYRFVWHSAFRLGNNGTEHNDSWLRFPDAADFFGRKGNGSVVYPNGTGKQPNPAGSSSDGWFKIYRSGNDTSFKWQSATSDHDAHDIFVTFSGPGVYLMEVSVRSDYHAIDRILLFEENIDQNNAFDAADTFSQKTTCN
ncbi:MAG: hypothetical protein AAGH81_17270 [Bacteroidota bacterium]